MCIDKGVVVKLFLLPYGCVHMIRLLSIAIFMFPLFLTAETITVKTKAPRNFAQSARYCSSVMCDFWVRMPRFNFTD
jgi:hypothetical protein